MSTTAEAYLRSRAAQKTETPIATQLSAREKGDLTDITKFLQQVTDKRTWIRLAFFTGGSLLALIGILKMTGDNRLSETTKTVGKTAVGLLPGGGTVVRGVKQVVK